MTAFIIIAVILIFVSILLTAPSLVEFSFKWDENERKFSLKLKYLFFKKMLFPRSDKKKAKPKKEKKSKKRNIRFPMLGRMSKNCVIYIPRSRTML